MAFRTKIDYSDNRQVKQDILTSTDLSGTTVFGVPFSAITSGVDLDTVITTSILSGITSTFSGNTSVSDIVFGDPRMVVASISLDAITNVNSGDTQTALGFEGKDNVIIDGNTVYLNYTGSTFDFTVTSIEEVAPSTWTGETYSDVVSFLSGSSLDYQDNTIWVDVKGITKTEQLVIEREPEIDNTILNALVRQPDGKITERNLTYVHDIYVTIHLCIK